MITNTFSRQNYRSLFYNERDEPRTWFCIALYPVALLIMALGLVIVAVVGPQLIMVGAIGASCHWLSEVGRR